MAEVRSAAAAAAAAPSSALSSAAQGRALHGGIVFGATSGGGGAKEGAGEVILPPKNLRGCLALTVPATPGGGMTDFAFEFDRGWFDR